MSNLKTIRESKGLSQSQLANASGINVRIIQSYEQGLRDINKAQAITLQALAKALDSNIENLLEL